MTKAHLVPILFLTAGFLFLVAAVVPALRGEALNVTFFVLALALFVIGGIAGARARGAGDRP